MHVFIDTNIFIRVATQGRPGCEHEHFKNLRTLVEGGSFTLIVPEVVQLEVEKSFRSLAKELESKCDKLSASFRNATKSTWNEIDSIKSETLKHITKLKQSSIASCEERSKQISDFLSSSSVTSIPLTPDIVVSAKRRLIAGNMPNCKKSSDQDALIVESLVSYFRSYESDESLLFCTENTNDFALEIKSKELDRTFVLYPDIQETLPKSHFSTTLFSMLSLVNGFEHLPKPSSEEIEDALAYHDLHNDVDDELFGQSYQALTEAVNKEYVKQFGEEFLPSLPIEIQNLRTRLADKITQLLENCRNCSSWDERSEYKLPQWIEFVDEDMIPYTSIPNMVRIKNNLVEYLELHIELDLEQMSEGKGS